MFWIFCIIFFIKYIYLFLNIETDIGFKFAKMWSNFDLEVLSCFSKSCCKVSSFKKLKRNFSLVFWNFRYLVSIPLRNHFSYCRFAILQRNFICTWPYILSLKEETLIHTIVFTFIEKIAFYKTFINVPKVKEFL